KGEHGAPNVWSCSSRFLFYHPHHSAVRLGKKSRLRGGILRVGRVAQANANEAKPLLRPEADAFPQRQGDIRQFLARRRWRTWRVTASENLEFAGFQFQYNCARDS